MCLITFRPSVTCGLHSSAPEVGKQGCVRRLPWARGMAAPRLPLPCDFGRSYEEVGISHASNWRRAFASRYRTGLPWLEMPPLHFLCLSG